MTIFVLIVIAIELSILIYILNSLRKKEFPVPYVTVHPPIIPAPIVNFTTPIEHTAPKKQTHLYKKGDSGEWRKFASVREDHPHIKEALDTPGLAIECDGKFDEGIQ